MNEFFDFQVLLIIRNKIKIMNNFFINISRTRYLEKEKIKKTYEKES
jgi:hypothetical protein